jgi:hypothetical protein
MIIIYPMLTSPSVSPNVLPGIIKSVEKYILVYKTDEILKKALKTGLLKTGSVSVGQAAIAAIGAGIGAYAAKKVTDYLNNNIQTAIDNENVLIMNEDLKSSGAAAFNRFKDKIDQNKDQKPKDHPALDAKPHLQIPAGDAVSLEPTWFQVTAPGMGMKIVGVKVVPFTIKSPENVISLMSRDTTLKRFDGLLKRYTRSIARVFQRLNPFRGSVSSDKYEKTILYGGSSYGENLFICFSQLDLQSESQFSDANIVRKLHKLGWVSFIIANDVNRTATFCMKEFGGVCSYIPYSYIFASLGTQQAKAYEDLEDLKRKSGPFFRMSTNRKRVFASESSVPTIVDKYLELLERENE